MTEKKRARSDNLMTECSCRAMSCIGSWCFGCGHFRPSKPVRHADERDLVEHAGTLLGHRLAEFGWSPNHSKE
jgi:hypothetical protein